MSQPLFRLCLTLVISLTVLSARAGQADDDLRLAARLHQGGETPRAVAIWQRWAARGNPDAAYNLAVIHQHGDGVPLDPAQAMAWYRVAAEQGDKVSQFQIGLMYQTGQGVAADPEEAHRWFTLHRRHHFHHQHDPRMVAWRKQALALIDERDRREQAALARKDSHDVIAGLKQRARTPAPSRPGWLAASAGQ